MQSRSNSSRSEESRRQPAFLWLIAYCFVCRRAADSRSGHLAPVESRLLVGNLYPFFRAVQRLTQCTDGQLRAIVFLTQVRGHQMLQARDVDPTQQRGGLLVCQMAIAAADSLLQRGWIARFGQQVFIVVAFDDQGITSVQCVDDMCGDDATVGEDAEAMSSIGKAVLHRFAGIVRYRIGLNFEVADGKSALPVDDATASGTWRVTRGGHVRAMRQIDRQAMASGERKDTSQMIAMLVRDQDGSQLPGLQTKPGEALARRPGRKTAVE